MGNHQPTRLACTAIAFAAAVSELGNSLAAPIPLDAAHWRTQDLSDVLSDAPVLALTLSPRGQLWIVRGAQTPVAAYDGWSARSFPPPAHGGYPVSESRSGQIWSLHPEGLQEFRRGEWVIHPVDAVQTERNNHPLRVLRSIPVLPAERDRVLLALPDAILKHDVTQRRSTILRTAPEGGIGRFVDLIESRNGDAWVVGTDGAARVEGPLRRITASTPWQVAALPSEWGLRCMGRTTFEDDEERLLVLAGTEEDGAVAVLVCDGTRWSAPVPAPRGTRHVWVGSGGDWWAHTRTTIHIRRNGSWQETSLPNLSGAQYFDVAVDASGAFWLATSQGIVRHAHPLWQHPPGLPPESIGWTSVTELPDSTLILGAADRLMIRRESQWSTLPLPVDQGGALVGPLHRLGGRALFVNSKRQLMSIDADASAPVQVPGSRHLLLNRILGALADGRLLLQTGATEDNTGWRIEAFDGAAFETYFVPPLDWSLGSRCHFVHASRGGTLWLGTDLGLALWNDRQRTFTLSEGFPSLPAHALVDVPNGRLWCASGRTLFEGDGRTWTVLRTSPVAVDRLVTTADGVIWGLAGKQLLRQIGDSWLTHDSTLGLPDATVNDVWLDRRGELWAVTDAGLRQLRPEADLDAPESRLSSAAGRREFPTSSPIRFILHGRDRWDSTPANHLMFSLRLNEGAWSPFLPEKTFVLTNLTAGQQRLAVRAMDPAFNEETDPAIFEFTTYVPWHAEPRIVSVALAGMLAAAVLAGLAINRHFRLRRSYAEVERIVEQRTRELERANLELVHSQKMRALGALAAGIAHDFNSILSIIQGSAQIIESNPSDPAKILTRVDRIKKMVNQGTLIVKTMLGLSRASKQEWRTIDLQPWLEDTTRLVNDQLPRGIAIGVESPHDLPQVLIVPDLLRQMLLNLILNAAESMEGHGNILLRSRHVHAPADTVLPPSPVGPQLVIEVLDTGQGIDPETLPRIFEPFFTTKAFSTRRGTGLGLTMVYEIARELGLGLGVASTPKQGSVFTIYLPLDRPPPK